MDLITLRESIRRHEGSRDLPYRDTVGLWTIAIGHLVDDDPLPFGAATVGDVLDYITDRERHAQWLEDDIEIAIKGARDWLGDAFTQLSEPAQRVIVEMAYQLGGAGLAKFVQMRAALVAFNMGLAADCGLNSKWATQTPHRAKELMATLRG